MVPLRVMTAQVQQASLLPLGFHALGGDMQVQVSTQANNSRDNRIVSCVNFHVSNEGLIDLDVIDRKLFEVGE